MGFKDEVHMSAKHTQWIASQPDAVLSPEEGFREIDKGDWNTGSADYIHDPWQSAVIRKDMARVLEVLATAVDDELRYAVPEYLDVATAEDVDVLGTMKWIVAQISSRFIVGLPLCRNKDYLYQSLAFADLFILNSGLLIYTPSVLKPIVGFLITLPTRYRRWKIKQYIKPLYNDRVQRLGQDGLKTGKCDNEPIDNLQLMLRYAVEKVPHKVNLTAVSDRVCLSNLASFHQTAVAVSHALINIAASDPEFNTAEVIRQEIAEVLRANGGVFSKAAAAKMIHTDSVMKESLRTHPFGTRAMIRKVVAREGVKTPDGHVIPQGATTSVLSWHVHQDPDLYENPTKFDPFRFSRQRREPGVDLAGNGLAFVSTGPTYLPFGHGKHACPGRFLVDMEIKMMLHHVLQVYDVALLPEHDGIRPETPHLINRERLIVTSAQGLREVLAEHSYDFVKPHLLRAMVGKILGYGLLLSEGDVHKLQRKNLMPAFSFRHIKELYPIFWSKAQELVHGMEAEIVSTSSSTVDMADWASRASLDIVGSAGMGHEFNSLSDPTIEDTMKMYGSMIKQSRGAKLLTAMQLIFPAFITDYLPFQRNMGVLAASKAARATSRKLIDAKRAQMAQDEKLSPDVITTALQSGHFTDEGLVDTMMTFLAAGHETSAAALTWTIYLLAQNISVQDRLRAEIRHHVPAGLVDTAMDAKTLDNIQYLHAVCQESLRMYAPIPFTVRDADKDTTILGQFVPKGTMVILCPWAINYDHELWGGEHADVFAPERWMQPGQANSGGAKSNYANLTFLHGPRSCIGQKFAVAELMALTCALVGRFEFSLPKGGEVIGDITDGIVAKPQNGLKVLVRRCEGCYARGDLLNGCKALVPGLRNAYGYTPSLGAGIAFSTLFAILGVGHLVRSVQKRRWSSYLLAISCLIELVGWVGRAWSSKCPYNKIAFLMQITTLVVAPIFIAAGIYVCLGYLIKEAGGAALASAATNSGKDPQPGAKMMVGGIIFQLVCVTVFTLLFGVFIWRTRRIELARGQNLVICATCISVTAVFIRCIYRTIELLQGWDGYLMHTEGFFIGLDAVCMVVAIAIFSVFDPSVLMTGETKLPPAQPNPIQLPSSNFIVVVVVVVIVVVVIVVVVIVVDKLKASSSSAQLKAFSSSAQRHCRLKGIVGSKAVGSSGLASLARTDCRLEGGSIAAVS
ncbi:pisatin demethylase cytochrome P450 monooxygenase [Rhypophila decipiens]|uniref:Pisatin demethylase cytochrome P450 monooxygenase n=1 Tax=Rhypophila decipiens TaxID=261697 RepID=A0AAN7B338_9PEZI|nr:pisatin demethylase cytochrome P450 monooxygenase [Rhypophila decipiens]